MMIEPPIVNAYADTDRDSDDEVSCNPSHLPRKNLLDKRQIRKEEQKIICFSRHVSGVEKNLKSVKKINQKLIIL